MPNDGAFTRVLHPDVVQAALAGLMNLRKTLPPKLFYDQEGSRLFRRITELPEYYLTRTELRLLPMVASEVVGGMAAGAVLVEYGANDESKAIFLLRARDGVGAGGFAAYVPIDVAAEGLEQARVRLAKLYPRLHVHFLAMDFLHPVTLPDAFADMPRLGFFPGSTIGNLDPAEAKLFLARIRKTLGRGARLLIGVDLRKDPAVLIPAYNDEAGVTAAFNLNLLVRLNREAGADFDLTAFSHKAIWNPADSRIEMHLISRREQIVHIAGRSIGFAANETIHTENSYKYTIEEFVTLAGLAAWRACKAWTDDAGLFSVHLVEAE